MANTSSRRARPGCRPGRGTTRRWLLVLLSVVLVAPFVTLALTSDVDGGPGSIEVVVTVPDSEDIDVDTAVRPADVDGPRQGTAPSGLARMHATVRYWWAMRTRRWHKSFVGDTPV